MRLLHAITLEFKVFHDDLVPPYLILSHTWGDEEVSYQEMQFLQRLSALPDNLKQNEVFVAALQAAAGLDFSMNGRESIVGRAGYKKIERTAEIAQKKGVDYFWIDTCCIDKSSSAELQEAINSMYQWYQRSSFCAVYLEDVRSVPLSRRKGQYFHKTLRASRWITRGWTLQELIAPSYVGFYDREWNHIYNKRRVSGLICLLTGIPEYVLTTGDLSQASVAQKMSWAASRQTTRTEDRAYSLMGIFSIHMAMLYGEGENAFRRLQEEIIRTSSDDSIFAWTASKGSLVGYRGLLANSPVEFQESGKITRGEPNDNTFAISNLGLHIEAKAKPRIWNDTNKSDCGYDYYLFRLDARFKNGKNVSLLLHWLEPLKYARVKAGSLWEWTEHLQTPTTLYIEHIPKIPRNFKSHMMHCFYVTRSSSVKAVPTYQIECVRPYALWNSTHSEISIPTTYTPNSDFFCSLDNDFAVTEGRRHFISILWLSPIDSVHRHSSPPLQILLGYDPTTGRVWCKILDRNSVWPDIHAPKKVWRAALCSFGDFRDCNPYENIPLSLVNYAEYLNVRIRPGLHRGLISHIVEIDGLQHNPENTSIRVID